MSSFATLSTRHSLHIAATATSTSTTASPLNGDLALWDDDVDKILRSEDISTPTGIEQFFETAIRGRKFPAAIHNHNHDVGAGTGTGSVEPSSEPCTEEIPWDELVYWLGNATTGELDCSCSTCQFERSQGRVPVALSGPGRANDDAHARGHYVYIPSTFYKRLSAMIPVIAVPRIEGVN